MHLIENTKLTQNIKNTFGNKGETWLVNLASIIHDLSSVWQLNSINAVTNMTYHYVAKVLYQDKPAVLKIGCDAKSIQNEMNALKYFNGQASIRLLNYHKKFNALLLQQAVPGISLKSIYPKQPELALAYYADILRKLHIKKFLPQNNFQSIDEWLTALDKVSRDKIPENLLNKAIKLKNKLLASLSQNLLLHGDLHHDNVLQHGDQWLMIDPKGIIGEREFEAAAFDFIHPTELDNAAIKEIFAKRANNLAEKSNLNAPRIKDWVIVRLILSAAWSIEDNSDPSWAIDLAKKLI